MYNLSNMGSSRLETRYNRREAAGVGLKALGTAMLVVPGVVAAEAFVSNKLSGESEHSNNWREREEKRWKAVIGEVVLGPFALGSIVLGERIRANGERQRNYRPATPEEIQIFEGLNRAVAAWDKVIEGTRQYEASQKALTPESV